MRKCTVVSNNNHVVSSRSRSLIYQNSLNNRHDLDSLAKANHNPRVIENDPQIQSTNSGHGFFIEKSMTKVLEDVAQNDMMTDDYLAN